MITIINKDTCNNIVIRRGTMTKTFMPCHADYPKVFGLYQAGAVEELLELLNVQSNITSVSTPVKSNTKQITTPNRDKFGRFISNKVTMPKRDSKGRFISAGTLPKRDSKGRFLSR